VLVGVVGKESESAETGSDESKIGLGIAFK
jgi:hypothetical protein